MFPRKGDSIDDRKGPLNQDSGTSSNKITPHVFEMPEPGKLFYHCMIVLYIYVLIFSINLFISFFQYNDLAKLQKRLVFTQVFRRLALQDVTGLAKGCPYPYHEPRRPEDFVGP